MHHLSEDIVVLEQEVICYDVDDRNRHYTLFVIFSLKNNGERAFKMIWCLPVTPFALFLVGQACIVLVDLVFIRCDNSSANRHGAPGVFSDAGS